MPPMVSVAMCNKEKTSDRTACCRLYEHGTLKIDGLGRPPRKKFDAMIVNGYYNCIWTKTGCPWALNTP